MTVWMTAIGNSGFITSQTKWFVDAAFYFKPILAVISPTSTDANGIAQEEFQIYRIYQTYAFTDASEKVLSFHSFTYQVV